MNVMKDDQDQISEVYRRSVMFLLIFGDYNTFSGI